MEFTLTKLLGFAAATCTTTAYAPQFIKAWKSRSTTDVSLAMCLLMVVAIFLWLVYGTLTGDGPVIVANAATMCSAAGSC
jgi:MtN3 and saliva related transmembrane protein